MIMFIMVILAGFTALTNNKKLPYRTDLCRPYHWIRPGITEPGRGSGWGFYYHAASAFM